MRTPVRLAAATLAVGVATGSGAAAAGMFDARVERLDFTDERSVGRINAWVEEATGGAIPELVAQLGPDDRLVLANTATDASSSWRCCRGPGSKPPRRFIGWRRTPRGWASEAFTMPEARWRCRAWLWRGSLSAPGP